MVIESSDSTYVGVREYPIEGRPFSDERRNAKETAIFAASSVRTRGLALPATAMLRTLAQRSKRGRYLSENIPSSATARAFLRCERCAH